jgi:hypothetical protein
MSKRICSFSLSGIVCGGRLRADEDDEDDDEEEVEGDANEDILGFL